MTKVLIMTTDAGNCHNSHAFAIKPLLEEQFGWDVRIVNAYREVYSKLDLFDKLLGITGEEAFNKYCLRKGYFWFYSILFRLFNLNIWWNYKKAIAMGADFFAKEKPDLVVSVMPFINGVMSAGVEKASPEIPFVTIMTSIYEFFPKYWVERHHQHLILATPKAMAQMKEKGHPPEKMHQLSGMTVRPTFYNRPSLDISAEREKLGLKPDLPTAVVMFGGHASDILADIAKMLDRPELKLQIIYMCGHNKQVADVLRNTETRYPKAVVDFTDDVPFYMQLADFFIGKPGIVSIFEAVQMNLPVLFVCNNQSLGCERINGDWYESQGFGINMGSMKKLPETVDYLLRDGNLAKYQEKVKAFDNNGVFEVPGILKAILEKHSPASGASLESATHEVEGSATSTVS